MKVRTPKWANLNVSTRYLTIAEVEKRKQLLNQIRTHFKENLPKEVYQEANAELRELFLL